MKRGGGEGKLLFGRKKRKRMELPPSWKGKRSEKRKDAPNGEEGTMGLGGGGGAGKGKRKGESRD